MITPAAAKAPVMPTIRPRTSGVCPAKEKPCFSEPRKISCRSPPAPAARRPLIEGRLPDDDGGDQERQRVEVERQVDLVDARAARASAGRRRW